MAIDSSLQLHAVLASTQEGWRAVMAGRIPFASDSLAMHLARGVIGFGSLAGAIALLPSLGVFSLLLAPVGLLALRGCPACWTIGLIETISQGRLQRRCSNGRCEMETRHSPMSPKAPTDIVISRVRRSGS